MQWIVSSVGEPVVMPQKDIDYMKENLINCSTHAFACFSSLLQGKKRG